MRFQEPPIKKTKGKNAKWYVRPYVDVLQTDGSIGRERRRFYLGCTESMSKEQAKVERKKVLETLNNGTHVLQAQVQFSEILDVFERRFVNVEAIWPHRRARSTLRI